MFNKNKVKVITDGPNQSIVFHHGDLDGYNGAQICQKWLEEQFGDSHYIKLVNCTYENINPFAKPTFEDNHEWRYIMIVDISVNEELASLAPENVYIFDHHDTSNYLIDMNPNFYWNEKYCGAVVAWKALFGERKDKSFFKLMKICNNYDMWQGPDGYPVKECFDMNALFWHNPKKWFLDFYDGFSGYNEKQQKIIDTHWSVQSKIWDEKISKHIYDDDQTNVFFIEGNDSRFDCAWWYNDLIVNEGFNVIVHLRAEKDRLSVRTSKERMDWFHIGEWLKDNITNEYNSKGGHRHAGGCSTKGLEIDEILEIGQKLENICKEHFEGIKI